MNNNEQVIRFPKAYYLSLSLNTYIRLRVSNEIYWQVMQHVRSNIVRRTDLIVTNTKVAVRHNAMEPN